MYVKTLMLEKASLKSFRDEEEALETYHNRKWWNDTLKFPVFSLNKVFEPADPVVDEEYEGGRHNLSS